MVKLSLSNKRILLPKICAKKLQFFSFFLLLMCSFSLFSAQAPADATIERVFLTKQEMESHSDSTIRELARSGEGGPIHLLFLKNFPKGKKIKYSIRRLCQIGQSYKPSFDFIINVEGLLTIRETTTKGIFIPTHTFLLGERLSCRFKSKDRKFEKIITFFPRPLIGESASGKAYIEAELTTIFPASFYNLTFHGFKENENLILVSQSGNETIKNSFKLTKELGMSFSPDVEGEKGGVAFVNFIRESGEKIRIEFPWGDTLFKFE